MGRERDGQELKQADAAQDMNHQLGDAAREERAQRDTPLPDENEGVDLSEPRDAAER